jgi:hypothetical protein
MRHLISGLPEISILGAQRASIAPQTLPLKRMNYGL